MRPSEWLIAAYFSYTALCSLVMDVRPGIRPVIFTVNALVIATVILLVFAERLRRRLVLTVMRDWFPLTLMLLAYREMGWLAPPFHTYRWEMSWIQWDRVLLNAWGLRAAIESLGPVVPSILEISYSLVYTIAPFCMAWIYYRRKPERMDAFLTVFLAGIFGSYALFPFFPSEPPRTVFPGADLPGAMTIFRRFNLGLVGNYGIHLSVFPSAHCSGAFAAAFAMREIWPEDPWVWRMLLVLAFSIATATVYGRYHYAADAAAGIAIALGAWTIARARRATI